MAKYIVITIAMSVKNNGIAYAGDKVDDSQLLSSAYDLKKDGAIRDLNDEELDAENASFDAHEDVTWQGDDSGSELSDEEKEALLKKEQEDAEAEKARLEAEATKKAEEEAAAAEEAKKGLSPKDAVKESLKK